MIPDKDIGCHRSGFQKTCFEGVTEHKCRLWTHIIGMNPSTGEHIDQFGCADEFHNKLMIENSQQQRQTAKAIESFRNAMVAQNEVLGLVHAPTPPMLEGESE
jgi:hypothetical protein